MCRPSSHATFNTLYTIVYYYIKDIRIMKSYYERKQDFMTFVFLNGTWNPTSIKRFFFYFIFFLYICLGIFKMCIFLIFMCVSKYWNYMYAHFSVRRVSFKGPFSKVSSNFSKLLKFSMKFSTFNLFDIKRFIFAMWFLQQG